MPLSFDDASIFMPAYLNPREKEALFSEIQHGRFEYFGRPPDGEPLQGDAWLESPVVDVSGAGEVTIRAGSAFLLSNSCDMARENDRAIPKHISYARTMRLSNFIGILQKQGVPQERIDTQVANIRNQYVSNIFYIPQHEAYGDEVLVFLDQVASIPPKLFFEAHGKRRAFSLSQTAFWYLLVKLSIHFCRAQEDVFRARASSD